VDVTQQAARLGTYLDWLMSCRSGWWREAHQVQVSAAGRIEGASLVSIKTGGCSEDCACCPQSARYQTGLEAQALLSTEEIVAAALDAKAVGATRFLHGCRVALT
jgi:biotin synthase-like enzyme